MERRSHVAFGMQCHNNAEPDGLRRARDLPALQEGWRAYFRKRLWEPDM